jgi:hypothetical protein
VLEAARRRGARSALDGIVPGGLITARRFSCDTSAFERELFPLCAEEGLGVFPVGGRYPLIPAAGGDSGGTARGRSGERTNEMEETST